MPGPYNAAHEAFARTNWDLIAPVAWQKYLEIGRGAMVVYTGPLPDFLADILPFEGMLPVVYARQIQLKQIAKAFLPKLNKLMRDYIPASEIIFVFYEPDGLSAYQMRMPGRPAPRDAYQARSN